jgi:hypothetical protein
VDKGRLRAFLRDTLDTKSWEIAWFEQKTAENNYRLAKRAHI